MRDYMSRLQVLFDSYIHMGIHGYSLWNNAGHYGSPGVFNIYGSVVI